MSTGPVQYSLEPYVCATCGEEHTRKSRWCSPACKARDWRETRDRLGLPEKSTTPLIRTKAGSQNNRILDRLRLGRMTSREMSRISLKYTSRISELRSGNYDIRVVSIDRRSGLSIYALFVDGLEAGT
jgi:hypothetical protein